MDQLHKSHCLVGGALWCSFFLFAVLVDGIADLQISYTGGNYAPSCCSCAPRHRKKVTLVSSQVYFCGVLFFFFDS
jgi:hypothetical protein